MSFDYGSMADLSLELLTEFGQTVTRRAYTAGAYDTSTGTVTNTTADTSRIGAIFPFYFGQKNNNGTLIQAGDFQLFLDADGPVALSDVYIIGGTQYTVVASRPISPAGTAVINTLHIRLS